MPDAHPNLAIAPEVAELLSDEQLAAIDVQVATGDAECIHCGETIDPEIGAANVVLLVDREASRAAARVAHAGCGPSTVARAELPGPAGARLAERWAAFVLPGAAVAVMQADAGVWTEEDRPALVSMLESLGFGPAREAFDSDLFATGVGAPPRASGVTLAVDGRDLLVRLGEEHVLESLPGLVAPPWGPAMEAGGGALVAIGPSLGLPTEGGIAFDELLPTLLDRAVAAFVPLG